MKKITKKTKEKKSSPIDLFNQEDISPKSDIKIEVSVNITKQYNLLEPDKVDIFIGDTEVAKSKPIDVRKEDLYDIISPLPLPNNGRRYIIYCDIKLKCESKKIFSRNTWLMLLTYEDIDELSKDSKDFKFNLERKFQISNKNKYEVEILSKISLGLENPNK